ncbi:Hypothetical protein FKW44_002115 [Caligus rogercresseyi]|uniref:Uncharacterized protein n=1 Tax=Caligus rogercresseyi TaxID=217165 RepID=A0A7T8KK30_CALRO|nr:Hypothetical protein FKW44_002115 [Caligus rogercresseyi]
MSFDDPKQTPNPPYFLTMLLLAPTAPPQTEVEQRGIPGDNFSLNRCCHSLNCPW